MLDSGHNLDHLRRYPNPLVRNGPRNLQWSGGTIRDMSWTATQPAAIDHSWSIEFAENRQKSQTETWLVQALEHVARHETHAAQAVTIWLPQVDDAEDEILAGAGFTPYRDLWQLRIDLPATATDLVTRAFTSEDADAFLSVNNRAFSWHPEQSGMTHEDLEQRQQEVWYRTDDFRMVDIDGRLAGFNWLKVHRPEEGSPFDPPMGEIYVIAVDPDFHGRGLGTDLALAGLAHLHQSGLTRAMLYVESDNHAANRVYERIGFTRAQTNRAYARPTPTETAPS